MALWIIIIIVITGLGNEGLGFSKKMDSKIIIHT